MPTSSASITGPGKLMGRVVWVHNRPMKKIDTHRMCMISA
jgi:hypothetical protein